MSEVPKYIIGSKGERVNRHLLETTGKKWVELNDGPPAVPEIVVFTQPESNRKIKDHKHWKIEMETQFK